MFHCGGTAVTYNVTGYDEYIRHGFNALVAQMGDDEAVVQHLRALSKDRSLYNSLCSGALETAAAWPSWEEASAEFSQNIEDLLSMPEIANQCVRRQAMLSSILQGTNCQSYWRKKLKQIPFLAGWLRVLRALLLEKRSDPSIWLN
jgi:hypothetical protein